MAINKRTNNANKETESTNGAQSLEAQKALLRDSNKRFSMVRNFYIADFLTLMNGACGTGSILNCLQYLANGNRNNMWIAFALIPFGVFFDVLDGRVARWRNESSVLGQELDSLADLISFGVAPACIGFSLGLCTYLDQIALVYFVMCGIARLARYNATVALLPKDGKGKVSYFEGTPIPTSLGIVIYLAYNFYHESYLQSLPLGTMEFGPFGTFHPIVLIYVALGSCMISRSLRIPKL